MKQHNAISKSTVFEIISGGSELMKIVKSKYFGVIIKHPLSKAETLQAAHKSIVMFFEVPGNGWCSTSHS